MEVAVSETLTSIYESKTPGGIESSRMVLSALQIKMFYLHLAVWLSSFKGKVHLNTGHVGPEGE
jgi:hypothetical protein